MAKKKKVAKAPREMTRRQLSRHKKQQRRQRIIFYSGIAIVVAVVSIMAGGWFIGEYLPLRETVIEVYDKTFDTAYLIDTMVIFGKGQGSVVDITDDVINQIMSQEVLKQEAENLGITITDEEARQFWENSGLEITNAALDFARYQLLPDKLKSDHFDTLVPPSDNQANIRAMMVESEAIAQLVRGKIISGENFTMLANEYAVDTPSMSNNGSYGFHPANIFETTLNSIALDYAFRDDVKSGDVSMPLSDNISFKQVGYWLIRVNDRTAEGTANVSAVYLSSEREALTIRERLAAGEELGPIADEYSQHSVSRQNHGEMGLLNASDNVSDAYNGYIFNPDTEVGEWSQPIRDEFPTPGGYWLVQLVDKEEGKELTTEDRNTLINSSFINWFNDIWTTSSPFRSNYITDDIKLWAIERASRQL